MRVCVFLAAAAAMAGPVNSLKLQLSTPTSITQTELRKRNAHMTSDDVSLMTREHQSWLERQIQRRQATTGGTPTTPENSFNHPSNFRLGPERYTHCDAETGRPICVCKVTRRTVTGSTLTLTVLNGDNDTEEDVTLNAGDPKTAKQWYKLAGRRGLNSIFRRS